MYCKVGKCYYKVGQLSEVRHFLITNLGRCCKAEQLLLKSGASITKWEIITK